MSKLPGKMKGNTDKQTGICEGDAECRKLNSPLLTANADAVISRRGRNSSLRTYARRSAMSCGTTSIRLSTHCRTVHCLIMDRCVQKCSMRNVRMKAEFVFMEKSLKADISICGADKQLWFGSEKTDKGVLVSFLRTVTLLS